MPVSLCERAPAYSSLLRTGELEERVRTAYDRLPQCDLCTHHCGVNRRATSKGPVCRTGEFHQAVKWAKEFGLRRLDRRY